MTRARAPRQVFSFKPGELVNRTEEEAKKKPRRVRALSVNPVSAEQAGSDEGLLSFCLPHSRLYGQSP